MRQLLLHVGTQAGKLATNGIDFVTHLGQFLFQTAAQSIISQIFRHLRPVFVGLVRRDILLHFRGLFRWG